ncbi:MAG: endonuclease NucS domain-containing protein [Candidatus Thorarchaeota archaeon]
MRGTSGKKIGQIDILAKKKNDDSLLVIELKRNQSSDETVSQVQRYMAWVKQNIQDDVRGLIICTESDENMELALSFVKDLVNVKYYTVSFNLHDESPE